MKAYQKENTKFRDKIAYVGGLPFFRRPRPFAQLLSPWIVSILVSEKNGKNIPEKTNKFDPLSTPSHNIECCHLALVLSTDFTNEGSTPSIFH